MCYCPGDVSVKAMRNLELQAARENEKKAWWRLKRSDLWGIDSQIDSVPLVTPAPTLRHRAGQG